MKTAEKIKHLVSLLEWLEKGGIILSDGVTHYFGMCSWVAIYVGLPENKNNECEIYLTSLGLKPPRHESDSLWWFPSSDQYSRIKLVQETINKLQGHEIQTPSDNA